MAKSDDVGIIKLENGNYAYRFTMLVNGKQITKRKTVDENGNKLFHKAEPKAVEDYFKSKGLEDDDVMPIADAQIRNAQKDLDDATAKRDKGRQDGDPDATAEAIAAQKDAQERLDWWNKF